MRRMKSPLYFYDFLTRCASQTNRVKKWRFLTTWTLPEFIILMYMIKTGRKETHVQMFRNWRLYKSILQFLICINWRNYVNPVCCVATVSHQIRCMNWGHLGHCHGAIYHLKWYKIVCMRYLTCTFSQMKSINMCSMYLQSWVSKFPLEIYCSLNIEPHCLHFYACQCWPQTLAAICRTMGILDFSCCVRQGNYIWGLGN